MNNLHQKIIMTESVTHTKSSKNERFNRKLPRLIALSFIAMFLLGIFAEFGVRVQLIKWDDPVLTYENLLNSTILFKAGTFAFICIIVLDIIIAVAFYELLKSTNSFVLLLMVSLRLIYVAIKGVAIVGLALASELYLSQTTVDVHQVEVLAAQLMPYLKLHHLGFAIGLIFFGIHLIFLALLLKKANKFPRILVWLLMVAGVGYTLNSLNSMFQPDVELWQTAIIAVFIIPMTFAEVSTGLWLWIKEKKLGSSS